MLSWRFWVWKANALYRDGSSSAAPPPPPPPPYCVTAARRRRGNDAKTRSTNLLDAADGAPPPKYIADAYCQRVIEREVDVG